MLGCNKCNSIYHKDTRYGPIVGAEDGSKRTPVSIRGGTNINEGTCKKYSIEGSKDNLSTIFESGSLTEGRIRKRRRFRVW